MTNDILFEQRGNLAMATLNRPGVLNAQNFGMVRAFADQLTIWEADPAITRLLICGAGDRAFCAGGDVRALWGHSLPEQLDFFETEYWLCYRLAQSRLTTIAYMDGITMGGGVGLSIFADERLATARTVWAMPEVQIGFFPDIVASYFLPRLQIGKGIGRYLGVTGARLSGADCIAAGIATHYVREGMNDALATALAGADDIAAVLHDFTVAVPDSALAQTAAALNDVVDKPLPDFTARLRELGLLPDGVCVTSAQIIDTAMQIGARLSHKAAVEMDLRLLRHFLAGDTFREGVRARLIDKGTVPSWPDSPLAPGKLLEFFA